jgi:hypothetical protein
VTARPTWDQPGADPEADLADMAKHFRTATGKRPTHLQGTERLARLAFGKRFDESLRENQVTDTTWNWRVPNG